MSRRDDPSIGPVRSALGMRLGLAIFGMAVCVAGLVLFTAVFWSAAWTAVFSALIVLVAADLVVIVRRLKANRE